MSFREIKKVLVVVLFLNWLVAFAKIFIGLFSGSLSILTDGLHSLFDGATNIVGLIGISLAEKPADQDHPYGHRKYEAIASMVILLFLGVAAYEITQSIFQKLFNPSPINSDWLIFAVLIACLLIDFLVARYEYRKGQELKSTILKADSLHTKSHYVTTGAVIVGQLLIKLGLPTIIDPIIAAFVVVFIVRYLVLEIFNEVTSVLSDRAPVDEKKIREIVEGTLGVNSCHEIRTRGDEAHIFMDLHVVLDKNMPLGRAHEICDRLEEAIKAEIPKIKDITVHPEPDG